ncbi:MAG: DUF6431 domain-containing protein [Limisphaerales bacterium]
MHPFIDVNTYLLTCSEGIPEALRPKNCQSCLAQVRLHKHGKFFRLVFTLEAELRIPIYRFFCPLCEHSCSFLPDFIEPHQQVALDVQEEIVESQQGESLSTVAALTEHLPGGFYSEKTLWRWVRKWNDRLHAIEPQLWEWVFRHDAHIQLPRHRHGWTAWRQIWRQLQLTSDRWPPFLWKVRQLFQSLSLTERVENPTKPVHGIRASLPSQ